MTVGGVADISTAQWVVLNRRANDFGSARVRAVVATLVDVNDLVTRDISAQSLVLSAGGTISGLAGTSVLAGDVLVSASGALVWGDPGNDLDSLSVTAVSATLSDVDELVLASADIDADLKLMAGGDISQIGALFVRGTGEFRTAADVLLRDRGNDFGTFNATAGSATLYDSNALLIGNISVVSALALSVGGDLGAVVTTSVVAPDALLLVQGALVLHPDSNDFGRLTLMAGSATLGDSNALVLAASTLDGNLSLKAAGDIRQSDLLSVDAVADFRAGAALVLDNSGNDLNWLHVRAGSASLVDVNALVLGNISVTGNLSLSAGGDIGGLGASSVLAHKALISAAGELVLVSATLGSDLTLNAGGDISQLGELSVPGAVHLSTGQDIVLERVGNDFGTVYASGRGVALVDANALVLGDISVSTLRLSSGGDVGGLAGASVLAGDALLSVVGGLVLTAAANDFDALRVLAHTATLIDIDAVTLGPSSLNGALHLSVGEDIRQTGALLVGADAHVSAGQNIALHLVDNDFGTLYALAGSAVLVDANALLLGDISATTSLSLSAGGDVGAVVGTSVLASDALLSVAGVLVLTAASNDFDALRVWAHTASLRDRDTVTLGPSSLGGELRLTAGADISQAGGLTVGTAGRFSTLGDLLLTQPDNHLGTLYADAGSVALVNARDLVLGDISVSSGLLLSVAGDLSDDPGASVLAANAELSADGEVVLDGDPSAGLAQHDLGLLSVRAVGLSLRDLGDLTLGSSSLQSILGSRLQAMCGRLERFGWMTVPG